MRMLGGRAVLFQKVVVLFKQVIEFVTGVRVIRGVQVVVTYGVPNRRSDGRTMEN